MNIQFDYDSDGILHISFPEEIDEITAHNFIAKYHDIINKNDNLHSLIDLSNLDKIPDNATKNALVKGIHKFRKPYPNEKSAIIGLSSSTKIVIRLILTLARRPDVRVFNDKEKALEWLGE